MRALPGGDEEVREAADEGGGGQADRADEEQVHHVALAHVRDVAGHGRGDGVARATCLGATAALRPSARVLHPSFADEICTEAEVARAAIFDNRGESDGVRA